MYTHTHRTTDRTTNLLISSNVHFVHLGGDENTENVLNGNNIRETEIRVQLCKTEQSTNT